MGGRKAGSGSQRSGGAPEMGRVPACTSDQCGDARVAYKMVRRGAREASTLRRMFRAVRIWPPAGRRGDPPVVSHAREVMMTLRDLPSVDEVVARLSDLAAPRA